MPRTEKPTPYYHMKTCELAERGWRKTKNGNFQGELGTFMSQDGHILFIGWSGAVIQIS